MTGGASNSDRSNLWDSNNSKYVDKYTANSGSQSTYYDNIDKYGDAVYETSLSGNSDTGSWNSTYSQFPNSSFPVFVRGGRSHNASNAGIFSFYQDTGEDFTSSSFRPVVINL